MQRKARFSEYGFTDFTFLKITSAGLRNVCVCVCFVIMSCPTLCDPMDYSPPGASVHRDSPDENTGVGCHALLQAIFPIQGLHPALLHCGRILYCLNHQGSLRILEWVAYPFFRVTSWPRNWTGVSCIVGGSLPAELPEKPIYLCIYNGEIS